MGFLSDALASVGNTALDMYNSNVAHHWAQGDASRAQDFSAYMSGTAHQREVADLEAAGLNPALSATGGGGASAPPGVMATEPTMQKADVMQSALSMARTKKDLEEADSRIELNKSHTSGSDADTTLKNIGWVGRLFGAKGSEILRKIGSELFSGSENSAKSLKLGDFHPFNTQANRDVMLRKHPDASQPDSKWHFLSSR